VPGWVCKHDGRHVLSTELDVHLPLTLGPSNVPPMMGMTILEPRGPFPTLKDWPSWQFKLYRNSYPGAAGALAMMEASCVASKGSAALIQAQQRRV
jgi:hypothetical protein